MSDLGTLGGSHSWAYGPNDSGQVVGWTDVDSQGDGVPYLYSNGVMSNLNGLLDSTAAGWPIGRISGINDAGQMAANAWNGGLGQWHAVLLTPDAGVAGSVSLRDFAGDISKVPIVIEIRNRGTTTALQRQTVSLSQGGAFSFPSALIGTFDVTAKASHWLRQKISNVTLPGTGFVGGLSFSLVNGDVNGDNVVDLADLVAISRAWRTVPGNPNYNPAADLNGDGSIDIADWLIVSRNWRKQGSP